MGKYRHMYFLKLDIKKLPSLNWVIIVTSTSKCIFFLNPENEKSIHFRTAAFDVINSKKIDISAKIVTVVLHSF